MNRAGAPVPVPRKWRIKKPFINVRAGRRCKESCRMRRGGERGLIILSRTISCQPGAAFRVVVARMHTLARNRRCSANATHSRTRVRVIVRLGAAASGACMRARLRRRIGRSELDNRFSFFRFLFLFFSHHCRSQATASRK